MDFKRDTYKPERYGGISLHNEPPDDLVMTTNCRLYPDMYYVYKSFAEWLGLPVKNIMLGNGAENVIKNVLLALKPKSISWSIPTWGFIDVYCAQLGCQPIKHKFKRSGMAFEEEDFTEEIDVYYNTIDFNSVLQHFPNAHNIFTARASIIDLTYCSLNKIQDMAKDIKTCIDAEAQKNIIYVGSFDKLFGAGLRLGFAFYTDQYANSMAIQRENYINQLAADFILKHEFKEPEKKYWKLLKKAVDDGKLSPYTMLCKSFITVPWKADYTQLQHREIEIDGHQYSKFGIPHDEEEWFQLQMTLGITK